MQARRQAALVELGHSALMSSDLSTLMGQAVRLVAGMLDVEYSKILEPSPGSHALLLRAGIGWQESGVGQALIGLDTTSPAGYTWLSGMPVLVEDWCRETRWQPPALLCAHRVCSSLCVSIRGGCRPLGVLGADSTRARRFSDDDVHFLQAVANVLGMAIERSELVELLRTSESGFRRLAENAPDIIYRYYFAPAARFDYVSPAATAITGYDPADYYADPQLVLRLAHPDDRPLLDAAFRTPAAGQAPLTVRMTRKDGRLIWTEQRIVPLLDSQGQVVGIEGIVRDVTAQGQAVVEERQRLARDLHDSVTQALYGMTLYAEAATRMLASGDMETVASHLHELQNTAQEALQEMRLLIFELRPPLLAQQGLVAALRARLEAVESRSNLETDLIVEGNTGLAAPVEQALYRIAQEALNNVLKHAHARHVTVQLRLQRSRATLEIVDDGIGFDLAKAGEGGGMGLCGIAERVECLGGRLQVHSGPGAGTQVRVEVLL